MFKIPLSTFTISGKTIKSYCHGTDLKNKYDSLHLRRSLLFINLNARVYFVTLPRHPTESCTFLSGKPEINVNGLIHFHEKRYLFTDFAGELCNLFFFRWGNTQRRHDHSWLALTMLSFCEKAWHMHWPIRTRIYHARFQTKTNDRIASRLAMGL